MVGVLLGVKMEVELDLRDILMKISDEKNKDEEYANVDLKKSEFAAKADDFVFSNRHSMKFDGKISLDLTECIVKDVDGKNIVGDDDKHFAFVSGRRSDDCGTDEIGVTKSSVVREDENNRKRKRESYTDLLSWVTDVAKDPCDPAIGSLPERSKWKSYGNDVIWKQVLLLRDEMLLKKSADTSAQCSIWRVLYFSPTFGFEYLTYDASYNVSPFVLVNSITLCLAFAFKYQKAVLNYFKF